MKKIERIFEIKEFYSVIEHNFGKGYTFVGESHDFWEMVFVSSGTVEVTCDDAVYILSAGDMLFYPPLCFHNVNSVAASGARVLNVAFGVEGELPDNTSCNVFSLSHSESEEFEGIFEILKSFFHSDTCSTYLGQLSSQRFSSLIIELGLDHTAEQKLLSTVSAFEYKRLVSDMRERIYDNISLSELAGLNHISVSYINMLFSRYAGIGPKSFYSQLRLNTAKSLLKSGVPIADVSARMNFSSHNYFARYFKKLTGLTPSEYKRATDIASKRIKAEKS